MNVDEISDNRLHTFLQRYIERNKLYGEKLKGLRFCGHSVLPEHNATFIVTDGERVRYSTLIRCHSVWSCPYCAPRVMADKGTDIACAIDALATWYNQRAAMLTFTLPHDKYMSCEDSFQILLATWRMFYRNKKRSKKVTYTLTADVTDENKSYSEKQSGMYKTQSGKWSQGTKNKNDKRAVGKRGDKRIYQVGYDPMGDLRETLKADHFVKVFEFTYGENGWHPHIHMLLWTPKANLQRIAEWEDKLLERWWHCARHQAEKYYLKKYPDKAEEIKSRVNTVYADYKKVTSDGHRSVYVSKDKSGVVISQSSSHYLAGWSGNFELTGGYDSKLKTARDGHFTPLQLLEKSCASAVDAEKYMPIFIEYAIATRGHRRVEFSKQSGIANIIKKWKESEEYIRVLKKKVMVKADLRPWKVVAWFSKEQWYDICEWDVTTDEDIRYEILQLAKQPDAWNAIAEYVQRFNVFLYPFEHPKQALFESQIYENKLLAEHAC